MIQTGGRNQGIFLSSINFMSKKGYGCKWTRGTIQPYAKTQIKV